MSAGDPDEALTTTRELAAGEGWCVVEVNCRAGPSEKPFEERHDWTSIGAVLSGTFTYRSDRGRALMAPGALVLGTAGACFECGHDHGVGDRCVSFHLAPELAQEMAASFQGAGRCDFDHAAIPPLADLLPLLNRVRRFAAAPDAAVGEALALDVAAAAIGLDRNAAEAVPASREEARAAEAARIIEARFAESLDIAQLAREVGMPRRRFASAFRAVVGVTPYQYILNRRLDAAAERLLDGGASVLDIALEVGCADLSEFTRRFADKFGRPPGAFRRRGP